jgi:hypothetical protein
VEFGMELELVDEESLGVAGVVAVVSLVELGEVDCCLEQAATSARALSNTRTLRFIDHLVVKQAYRQPLLQLRQAQRMVAKAVPGVAVCIMSRRGAA